jgi:hypothetical protein
MIDISHFILGETSETIHLDSSDDNRIVACALAKQSIRSIDIFTRHLDKRIYDDSEFVEAIKQLAVGHSHALIRILVQDSTRAAKQGHRLVNLGLEVTSKIKFHAPSKEHSEHNEAFMIVDHTGLVHRRQFDRYDGIACFNDPKQARELQARFDRGWEHSEPDPHLRRLFI